MAPREARRAPLAGRVECHLALSRAPRERAAGTVTSPHRSQTLARGQWGSGTFCRSHARDINKER